MAERPKSSVRVFSAQEQEALKRNTHITEIEQNRLWNWCLHGLKSCVLFTMQYWSLGMRGIDLARLKECRNLLDELIKDVESDTASIVQEIEGSVQIPPDLKKHIVYAKKRMVHDVSVEDQIKLSVSSK